jgi:hypothetical protein
LELPIRLFLRASAATLRRAFGESVSFNWAWLPLHDGVVVRGIGLSARDWPESASLTQWKSEMRAKTKAKTNMRKQSDLLIYLEEEGCRFYLRGVYRPGEDGELSVVDEKELTPSERLRARRVYVSSWDAIGNPTFTYRPPPHEFN